MAYNSNPLTNLHVFLQGMYNDILTRLGLAQTDVTNNTTRITVLENAAVAPVNIKLTSAAYYTSEYDGILRGYPTFAAAMTAYSAEEDLYNGPGTIGNITMSVTGLNAINTLTSSPNDGPFNLFGTGADNAVVSLSTRFVYFMLQNVRRITFIGQGVVNLSINGQSRVESSIIPKLELYTNGLANQILTVTDSTVSAITNPTNAFVTLRLKGSTVVPTVPPFGVTYDDQRNTLVPRTVIAENRITTAEYKIGTLPNLITNSKSDLVNAINETINYRFDRFRGYWNPRTNIPTLPANGSGVLRGTYYIVSADSGTYQVITGVSSYNVPYDTYVGFPSAAQVQDGSILTATNPLSAPYSIPANTKVVRQGGNTFSELIVSQVVNLPGSISLTFTYTPPVFAGLNDFRADDILYYDGTVWSLRPGMPRILAGIPAGTVSVARRTNREIELNLNAEYAPVTQGTISVDGTNKVIGSRTSVIVSPNGGDPTPYFTNGVFRTKDSYIPGKTLQYVFYVLGDGTVQYYINALD